MAIIVTNLIKAVGGNHHRPGAAAPELFIILHITDGAELHLTCAGKVIPLVCFSFEKDVIIHPVPIETDFIVVMTYFDIKCIRPVQELIGYKALRFRLYYLIVHAVHQFTFKRFITLHRYVRCTFPKHQAKCQD